MKATHLRLFGRPESSDLGLGPFVPVMEIDTKVLLLDAQDFLTDPLGSGLLIGKARLTAHPDHIIPEKGGRLAVRGYLDHPKLGIHEAKVVLQEHRSIRHALAKTLFGKPDVLSVRGFSPPLPKN